MQTTGKDTLTFEEIEALLREASEEDDYLEDEEEIYTKEEKNKLIASYGRNDIYVYAIRLDYLNAISIFTSDYEKDRFNTFFSHKSLASLGDNLGKEMLEIGDNYTLIKYLGNNKFQEYYTGNIITIYSEKTETPESFLTRFKEYKSNPLCIITKLSNLKVISSDIEEKVVANAKNKDRIISFITKSQELARRDLDKDFEKVIDNDYLYAKEEDNIYEFKKIIKE